jgi:hypothetical protein
MDDNDRIERLKQLCSKLHRLRLKSEELSRRATEEIRRIHAQEDFRFTADDRPRPAARRRRRT